jgi:hypothetical protein
MRTVKVLRMRVAGRPILVRFKRGMKNLADHWMAGRNNRNPRIPKGEVWVNARLLKDKERLKRVLAHERVEPELMMRKGYSYRQARIASRKEATLARRAKVALLVLLAPLLLASLALASPGLAVYNLDSTPSWYDGTLQPNQVKYLNFSWTQLSGYSEFNWQPDDWSSPFTLYLGGYTPRYVGGYVLYGCASLGSSSSYSWALTRLRNPWVPLAAYAYFINLVSGSTVTATITVTFNYADGTTSSRSASGSVAYTYTLGTGWLLYNGTNTGKLLSSVAVSLTLSAASSGSKVCVYLDGPWYKQVTQSFALSGSSFSPLPSGAMAANWTTRFGNYIVSISPAPLGVYLDEAAGIGSGTYAVTLAKWWANWTLPASTLAFYDSSMSSLGSATLAAGQYALALDAAPTYLELNSTLLYAPAVGNGTTLACYPASSLASVYYRIPGAEAVKVYDAQGRLIHAAKADPTGLAQVYALNLAANKFAKWSGGSETAVETVNVWAARSPGERFYRWTLPASTLAFYDSAMNPTASASLQAGTWYIAVDAASIFAKLNSTLLYAPAVGNGTTLACYPASSLASVYYRIPGAEAVKVYDAQGRLIHAAKADPTGLAQVYALNLAANKFAKWSGGSETAVETVNVWAARSPGERFYRWTLPASTLAFYDSAMNPTASASLQAGTWYIAVDAASIFAKLNSTLLYAPAVGNGSTLSLPTGPVLTVSFIVEDYGAGYQALKAYTLEGKLAGSRLIASKQATMNLTYGGTYSLALWKPGEERAFGLYAATSTSTILYVLPASQVQVPKSAIQAWYNQTDSNFYVVVNCSNPPCTVLLRKYYPNGTNTVLAQWICTQNYCRYTLLAADPLVTAEATDASGTKMMSFAGTSLFGLLNETQKQTLQDIFNKVAQGWPQSWGGRAGLLAFGGVLIFLALSIPGYLLLGALALGAYITLVGIIFNIWIVAGTGFTILIAVAAIEYIIHQS